MPILDMQWTVHVCGRGGDDLCVLCCSSQKHYIMILLDRHTFKMAKRAEQVLSPLSSKVTGSARLSQGQTGGKWETQALKSISG